MIITHKLHLDLVHLPPEKQVPKVHIVQKDHLSRQLEVVLLADGSPWPIPEDAHILLHYSKPDGHIGQYDTLPDGQLAWTIQENMLTLTLAPQVCNVSGTTHLAIRLLQGEKEVSTFPLALDVVALPEAAAGSEDYIQVRDYLPQPTPPAAAGQLLQVEAISPAGYVSALKTVDFPQAGASTLVVKITQDGSAYAADKSFAEIRAALDAGQYCHANFGGNILPIAEADANKIVFLSDQRAEDSTVVLSFTVTADDAVAYTFYATPILTAAEVAQIVEENLGLVVNITQDSAAALCSDKTFAQIKAAIDAGQHCHAVFASKVMPLAVADASQVTFSFTGPLEGKLNFFQVCISAEDAVSYELHSYELSAGEVLTDAEGVSF